jgi:thiamine transport system permease protein
MANSSRPLNIVALALAAMLLALVAAPLAAVSARATDFALSPSDWAAVRFTLLQATLSALFSTALAIPVARALARRRFVGREVLILLMGAPFLLPAIVAVLGLLAVFGRSGVMNDLGAALGLPTLSVPPPAALATPDAAPLRSDQSPRRRLGESVLRELLASLARSSSRQAAYSERHAP